MSRLTAVGLGAALTGLAPSRAGCRSGFGGWQVAGEVCLMPVGEGVVLRRVGAGVRFNVVRAMMLVRRKREPDYGDDETE